MNSKEYWHQREKEALKKYQKNEKEYDKEIKQIYTQMLDSCEREINAFYGKYATKEGITIAQAKKRVSKLDIEKYERKAAKYVKDKDFSDKANEEMRLYNLTMKVNRLEMLKANIGIELIKGHDELDKFMGDILQGRTEEELKRQAGILGKTIRNNAQLAHTIPNASFHNATFSDRIWQYQDLMREDLSKILSTALIQGKNPRAIAKDLRKYWYGADPKTKGGAVYCMERLMRTELAKVQTEAQKQSFEKNGFEEYMFIANSDCCGICKALDGKPFKVSKMMPGENAAPLHPHCRCSVAAYEDSDEYEAWLDYLDKGGTTEEWNKFKKGLENSKNINIIKSGANHGAYTDKNDPDGEKRRKSAEDFYEQILNRDRNYEIKTVSKNTGFSEEDIDRVFTHIFELKHLFKDGTVRKFDPDYYMQHSWVRLRDGKNIQKHDITLLNHELAEAKIMGTGLDVVYEVAHAEVEKTYNYTEDLLEYLKDHDA